MDKKEVVAVGVRLFAIALVIYSFRTLPDVVIYSVGERYQTAAYMIIGLLVFVVILATILWKFPLTVAGSIIPKTPDSESKASWDPRDLLTVGLILLGVYFLYLVISDSIYWFFVWQSRQSMGGIGTEMTVAQKASMVATVVELLVAVWLIMGARGICNVIWHLRNAGHGPSARE
jgi:hypothetical protein